MCWSYFLDISFFIIPPHVVKILHHRRRQPVNLKQSMPLQWRHNRRDSVSNHQPCDSLLNREFRHRPKKTSKLRVTGLCVGNSPVTGEFPAKWPVTRNVSIWWRHHAMVVDDLATRGGQGKMATSLQTTHSNAFSSMKNSVFQIKNVLDIISSGSNQ